MINKVDLVLPETGQQKMNVKLGFSWTTLFFGFFVPLFRGDWLTFFILLVVDILFASVSFGLGMTIPNLIWAFFYNHFYARRLYNDGYVGRTKQEQIAFINFVK